MAGEIRNTPSCRPKVDAFFTEKLWRRRSREGGWFVELDGTVGSKNDFGVAFMSEGASQAVGRLKACSGSGERFRVTIETAAVWGNARGGATGDFEAADYGKRMKADADGRLIVDRTLRQGNVVLVGGDKAKPAVAWDFLNFGGVGGEGISGVAHDGTLTGAGVSGDLLGVQNPFTQPDEDKLDAVPTPSQIVVKKSLFSEDRFWGINQNAAVTVAGEWAFFDGSNAVVSTADNALTPTEVSSIRFIEIHEDVFPNSDYLNAIANQDNSTVFSQVQTNGGVLYIHDTDSVNYGTIASDYLRVTITAAGSSKTGSVYKFACTVTQTGAVWNGGNWYAFDLDLVGNQKIQAQQLVDVQTLFAKLLKIQDADRLLAMTGETLGNIAASVLLSRYVEIAELIGDDTADFYCQYQSLAALLDLLTTDKRGGWGFGTNASGAPTTADYINQNQVNDGNYTLVIAATQQNSDWTYKPTAYTASDFESGDVLYAHPYDPYDAENYYKMTLTGNGVLVGTGNAAYIYAPVTVDEVGSVDSPSDGWRITETPPSSVLAGLRGKLPIAGTPQLAQASKVLLSNFEESTLAQLSKHIRPDTTEDVVLPTTFETTNSSITGGNNLIGIVNPLLDGVMQLRWSIGSTINDEDGNTLQLSEVEDRLNVHHNFEMYSAGKVIKGVITNFNKVNIAGTTFHQINLQDATQTGGAFTDGESVKIDLRSNLVARSEFKPSVFVGSHTEIDFTDWTPTLENLQGADSFVQHYAEYAIFEDSDDLYIRLRLGITAAHTQNTNFSALRFDLPAVPGTGAIPSRVTCFMNSLDSDFDYGQCGIVSNKIRVVVAKKTNNNSSVSFDVEIHYKTS